MSSNPVSIRKLTPDDFDIAEKILTAAFPRPGDRRADLARAWNLTPDMWFLAVSEGIPVGMVGAVVYDRFAWVGLMGVDPKAQSRGIGRSLMIHLLCNLDNRGLEMVVLDASPAGRPLYLSLGFIDEDEARMYEKKELLKLPSTTGNISKHDETKPVFEGFSVRPVFIEDLPKMAAFDAPTFGSNRGRVFNLLLKEFPGRSFLAIDSKEDILGYLFVQKKRIGPWVAVNGTIAEKLLLEALRLPFEESAQAIVPERNAVSREILLKNGFHFSHANRHMRRGGTSSHGKRESIFSQGSFGIG